MSDPLVLDFKELRHPSDLCEYYYGAGGVVSAVVDDELTFLDAMVDDHVNCILFAEDVVMRAETYAVGVRTLHACRSYALTGKPPGWA